MMGFTNVLNDAHGPSCVAVAVTAVVMLWFAPSHHGLHRT